MSVFSGRWVTLLLVAFAMFGNAAYAALPVIGQMAPDFVLKSNAGVNTRLSEYRSEVILMNFWGSWCRSCRTELQQMELLFADPAADVRVVSIFVDDDQVAARSAVTDLRLTFPVLLDEGQQISRLYDLPTLPVTVLIDRNGVVRFVHPGYKAGDEKLYRQELNQLLAE